MAVERRNGNLNGMNPTANVSNDVLLDLLKGMSTAVPRIDQEEYNIHNVSLRNPRMQPADLSPANQWFDPGSNVQTSPMQMGNEAFFDITPAKFVLGHLDDTAPPVRRGAGAYAALPPLCILCTETHDCNIRCVWSFRHHC